VAKIIIDTTKETILDCIEFSGEPLDLLDALDLLIRYIIANDRLPYNFYERYFTLQRIFNIAVDDLIKVITEEVEGGDEASPYEQ